MREIRHSADCDAGELAYPALLNGLRSECQERQSRCEELVDRIERIWYDRLIVAVFRLPEGPILESVAAYFSERDREFELARVADKYKLYERYGNPYRWVQPAWSKGSKQGEIKELIIRCADTIRKRESNGLKFNGTDPKDQTGKP